LPLTDTTKTEIENYFKSLLPNVESSVNNLKLKEIMEYKNPLVREMFCNNPQEFITFFVMERAERSFVTLMGNMIEKVVKILVEGQKGEIIGDKKDWKPYDLKFRLSDGKEYWLEIKSILNQNNSNNNSIAALRERAVNQGKEFRLCVYYPTNAILQKHDYILVGRNFWSFVGGDINTESTVFELLKGISEDFSFFNLVQERTKVLLQEYIHENQSVPEQK